MRVLVLGGTRFVGRAVVEELLSAGHAVTVVHRGNNCVPDDLAGVAHLHLARDTWVAESAQLASTEPDAVVDCHAMTRADADAAIAALPADPARRGLVQHGRVSRIRIAERGARHRRCAHRRVLAAE